MNLEDFKRLCNKVRPAAIVLIWADYHQLRESNEAPSTNYLGAPIIQSEYYRSYVIEDTANGPVTHWIK